MEVPALPGKFTFSSLRMVLCAPSAATANFDPGLRDVVAGVPPGRERYGQPAEIPVVTTE
ncbi:hypothetical protein [Amycolatopsis sp.]|uniref:hypothetical protein n=1 Tax=Amycolatopsis sp. TaxID=37632 RepID=UPI002D7ECF5E|nr:hypothetical protein [Amycolatopsis sp.]